MRIEGRAYRSIWPTAEGDAVEAIDQTQPPHGFATRRIGSLEAAAALEAAYRALAATRPTAVNLRHALDDVSAFVAPPPPQRRAEAICGEDVALNRRIGEPGRR